MFEKALKQKFERIFGLRKVTFDSHGDPADIHSDSKEQETLFVEIQTAKTSLKDGKEVARVQGIASVFCPNEKLPYGYFLKRIQKAKPEDVRDIFFYEMEQHDPVYLNLAKRSFSFIYLYSAQYDPNLGSITSLNVENA
jgi:hypothetical protein